MMNIFGLNKETSLNKDLSAKRNESSQIVTEFANDSS